VHAADGGSEFTIWEEGVRPCGVYSDRPPESIRFTCFALRPRDEDDWFPRPIFSSSFVTETGGLPCEGSSGEEACELEG